MKSLVRGLLRAGKPRVIAIFGVTRADVECAVRHAQAGARDLPIWAWCAENAVPVGGCERFFAQASAPSARRELRNVWPALSIVAWTGQRGARWLKLVPFTALPLRVLILNEAGDFFNGRPGPIAFHLWRRMCDRPLPTLYRTAGMYGLFSQWVAPRTRGLFIATLAFLTGWTGPIARSVVRRRRKRVSLDISLPESSGGSFTEVLITGRDWPRRDVLRALRTPGVDFVVFRKSGDTGDSAPLIEMARHTNAFAVARQVAHSAWRKRAVPKHPFRRLQPEEISEVLAPYSTLIAVRRDIFARLGCPRALTYGGALAILFWRASAAGLRALVAGSAGNPTDEQNMALEDFELALALSVTGLGSFCPREPARSRGNVACAPLLSLGFREGRPRVLVVSPYLPFPLSHGGAVRIYNLCRALADRVDLVLACFHEANEAIAYPELHAIFREVYTIEADEKRLDPELPAQVNEYRNSAMAALIRRLCHDGVNLVQIEYTQLAAYAQETGRAPVILVEHDITFALYWQLASSGGDPGIQKEHDRWLEFERKALQCSNAVWTMSPEDRALAIAHGAPRERTVVIPNGVDIERFRPMTDPIENRILFLGSFRHLPNLLAFEALRDRIMPAVWNECPDTVLHVIAGPQPNRTAKLAGKERLLAPDPRIVLDHFVADVRPAYSDASVVVVPLPVSAGTNIKVLEAMACGRPVVSTAVGCQGLGFENGRELIVADLPAAGAPTEFADAVVTLLRDKNLRARISHEARSTVERRFAWEPIALDAFDSYMALLQMNDTATVRRQQRVGF